MGSCWEKRKVVLLPSAEAFPFPFPSSPTAVSVAMALIRAVSRAGTVISAVYFILTPGVSWHGTMDLAWIAWHCVNM